MEVYAWLIDWFCTFPGKLPYGYNFRVNAKSDSTSQDDTHTGCELTFWTKTNTALASAHAGASQEPKAPFTDKIPPLSFDVTQVVVCLRLQTEKIVVPGPTENMLCQFSDSHWTSAFHSTGAVMTRHFYKAWSFSTKWALLLRNFTFGGTVICLPTV